ncbi:uncharacterized protein LOC113239546 [Hyposmocoma kahamanoa]|uniref:uncharacterized protein LOC113239546 n=1 Tax=Hyposmocoma kahamanoa TaxID=1477025 RepID=UPI000E6D9276|nr:uncharacterized protein LOC113239546 [Hyposmocoma kahamanoa]
MIIPRHFCVVTVLIVLQTGVVLAMYTIRYYGMYTTRAPRTKQPQPSNETAIVDSDDYYLGDDPYWVEPDEEDEGITELEVATDANGSTYTYYHHTTPRPDPLPSTNAIEFYKQLFEQTERGLDYATKSDRELLMNMSLELSREAYFTIRTLDPLKANHKNTIAYSVGLIIGKIREKYRKQMAIYAEVKARIAFDNSPKRSRVYGHSLKEFRPYIFGLYYQYCRESERDVESMIDMLEKINDTDLGGLNRYMRFKKNILRTAIKQGRHQQVEEYKKRNRRKYLRKKLGLNENSQLPDRHFKRD